jgi:hypothetical protein
MNRFTRDLLALTTVTAFLGVFWVVILFLAA